MPRKSHYPRLTGHIGVLISALLRRPEGLTVHELAEEVWPNPDQMPDWWHNFLIGIAGKARKLIEPDGWTIKCRTGHVARPWRLVPLIRSHDDEDDPPCNLLL